MTLAGRLLRWYRAGHRDLPWRQTREAYRIWVSEIMLQQTRASVVIPFYRKFLDRFPTMEALAAAPEAEVLACWSGLGYYSRARNLQRAARAMAGVFPSDYAGIRALPGIGDYTAAAVASIAFGLPHAAVDGNVLRVVARVSNDPADIGSSRTRARFQETAQAWLEAKDPGEFNEAMMELGATICLPRAPRCADCPLRSLCGAYAANTQAQLPVKLRKQRAEQIESTLVVVQKRGRILLWQRGRESSRMAGFWELPGPEQLTPSPVLRPVGTFRHTITHHYYRMTVCAAESGRARKPLEWIELTRLPGLALSTSARKALRVAGICC